MSLNTHHPVALPLAAYKAQHVKFVVEGKIATLTHGAYCQFHAGSAKELRDLLTAVAVFAAGGRKALTDYGKRTGGAALQLTQRFDSPR